MSNHGPGSITRLFLAIGLERDEEGRKEEGGGAGRRGGRTGGKGKWRHDRRVVVAFAGPWNST